MWSVAASAAGPAAGVHGACGLRAAGGAAAQLQRKVDRKALPAPERGPAAGFVAPRTPAEEVMAEIWQDLLKVERAGGPRQLLRAGRPLAARRPPDGEDRAALRPRPAARDPVRGADARSPGIPRRLRRRPARGRQGRSALVAVKPQGEATPFFCVHPIGWQRSLLSRPRSFPRAGAAVLRSTNSGPRGGQGRAGRRGDGRPLPAGAAPRPIYAGALPARRLVDGRAGRLRDGAPARAAGRGGGPRGPDRHAAACHCTPAVTRRDAGSLRHGSGRACWGTTRALQGRAWVPGRVVVRDVSRRTCERAVLTRRSSSPAA